MSETRGRGISVTVKYDKGYEAPWAVFTGLPHEVRADMLDYFGVDGASVAGLSMSELVVNLVSLAQGKSIASTMLGAVAIGQEQAKLPATTEATAGASDPWAGVGEKRTEEPVGPHPLIATLDSAADIPALKRVWAENQAAFSDAALMDHYRARGRAIKAATAAPAT